MYVRRFVEPLVAELMQTSPIVIIEGARAVGKTRLLAALHNAGLVQARFTLTDPTQLAAASENPLAWLRSLPQPFSIDEAQLLPQLPVALKSFLDETDESMSCILTGSAAIGQTGLGGADPLARRASRLTLEPLSEAEILAENGESWSVIDQFFNGKPSVSTRANLNLNWENRATRGGLPQYRIKHSNWAKSVLDKQIGQDIASILTDNVLPGERMDSRIAREILTHLLMHPGGEYNATSIAREIGIDVRTVNRYVDILERRFLINEIHNFHRPSKKSQRSSAKTYPADTALSSYAMDATNRTMGDAMTRGGMMESHVAQQIRSHLGWSAVSASINHWRENKNGRTSEVDIVLKDSEGRLVAIEIKSSSDTRENHFKGIKDFKRYYGERFHRGFVINTSEQAASFGEDLWSIPLASLYYQDFWETPMGTSVDDDEYYSENLPAQEQESMTSLEEAKIFISYSHQDQNSSTGGDIRQFAADVVDALEGIHDRTVQLFLDVEDIRWGDGLWSRLDDELQASTFLIPFITPRYLRSESCRREFTSFSEAALRAGSEQLLLPLIWVLPPSLSADNSSDPIIQRVISTSYINVADARRAEKSSSVYANLVEEVANKLNQVIANREEAKSELSEDADPGRLDSQISDLGFDEYFSQVEDLMPKAEEELGNFINDFIYLGSEFERAMVTLETKTPKQLRDSIGRISQELQVPNENLMISANAASRTWDSLMISLNRGLRLYSDIDPEGAPQDLVNSLRSTADQLEQMETSKLEEVAHQMPKMSSKLVPTSKSILSAVGTVRSMEDSIRSWLDAINK